ncbi:putative Laccase-2 [Glarea lozoyensis 74030]|uniref:Putative Laccase-2 n=1 Tax=Glarea lozoyensis (strain ATCC 74030 / MF5533) TaxID=1104152 RepID=H0ET37_GLAL7|nr:putative Laccase-2 [Glarea lozoyensis 74030]
MRNILVSVLVALAATERQACENSPTSRSCWGEYDIDTDFYTTFPNTGVIREYWLSIENNTIAPDGYTRQVLSFNGTVPGPAITADWGDTLVVHVTNNLEYNGTTVHWHGMRQLNSVEYDGVPGVTQCPIAPGDSLTYSFQVTQYGSSWYHSHFSLQYGDGLVGPLLINGPATADYDEDLGLLFLSDWSHTPVFQIWDVAKQGGPPTLENGLINGTNTFNCGNTTDVNCVGGGVKHVNVFEAGKKYRMRLVSSAIDGHFQFSIDGHDFQVISNDLVPIVPYTTDNLLIAIGQRYDIVVEAKATPGNYWYDADSTALPTTNSAVTKIATCGDEDMTNLVPHLAMDVTANLATDLELNSLGFVVDDYFKWQLNSSSLILDWNAPTTLKIFNNESIWPTAYNVQALENGDDPESWAVYVIEDNTGLGISHPIHLHGHDFWVIAQDTGLFEAGKSNINLKNPPRRDTATLPGNGHIAIAFKKDNPGSWLLHCHIAWHVSEGFAMQFVESESQISLTMTDSATFADTCDAWQPYSSTMIYPQDDSGV